LADTLDLADAREPAADPTRATDPTRAAWLAVGAADRIRAVYRDGLPSHGVDPERLRTLLGELDAHGDTGTVLSSCVQLATALPLLASAPADSPGARTMGQALSGAAVVALAATDSGPGSDLTALSTTVEEHGDALVLNGGKQWITNATAADSLLVLARRRPGPHFTNFSWLLVPAHCTGVRIEPADTDLFTGAAIGHITLDQVSVPRDAVIGGAGRGLALFARHITVERLAGGLWASALCHRALATTKARLVARAGLWERDSVRQRFAEALVLARQLDSLVSALAPQIAECHDHAAAALVKAAAGTVVEQVLGSCAHLHGAEGFSSGGLQRLRAEASVFAIAGGASEVVLATVADQADALLHALDPVRAR
jgi:alkylation response protein AidB-like acyl-CoA dehydrogenase